MRATSAPIEHDLSGDSANLAIRFGASRRGSTQRGPEADGSRQPVEGHLPVPVSVASHDPVAAPSAAIAIATSDAGSLLVNLGFAPLAD